MWGTENFSENMKIKFDWKSSSGLLIFIGVLTALVIYVIVKLLI
jgi:hypothetical protein